jgi:hypothetical protein
LFNFCHTIWFSFVAKVEADPTQFHGGRYCIKLPYSAGGYLGDKKSVKYTCKDTKVGGIVKAIGQMLRYNCHVAGYIPYIIVQPFFENNSEAKVSSNFII